MKTSLHSFHVAATALALSLGSAYAADEPATIKFSDPAKPGTMKINLGRGELHIQGADTPDVTVKSDSKSDAEKPRKDGLRVISAASGFSLSEKENFVLLDASLTEKGRGAGNFKVTVPRNTTIIVQNGWGGDISCAGISGDVEINSMQGEIRLEEVMGGVVASTMNGQIRANIRQLQDGKPLSFTSMNGEVVLRVPAEAKANVRLRTQNGAVLTDFEESVLATRTESSPGHPPRIAKGGRVITAEVQDAIREAAQIGATAVREALEAVKQGLEAAQLDSDEARRGLDAARRDLDRARREADRERTRVTRETPRNGETPPTPPTASSHPKIAGAPVPPKPPMATITGGKLVTGTLNGGGPEISVSTMNGDVILRKFNSGK